MKRLLVVFLALAVTTGAYAQFSVTGQLHTHFGLRLTGGDAIFLSQDGTLNQWGEDDRPAQWDFRFLTSQTMFQVNYNMDNVGGFFRLRGDLQFRTHVWGNVGDHQFAMGHIELPWVRWTPISFDGNSGAGIGALNSGVHPYFFGRFNVAPGMQVYVGLSEAGITAPGGTGGQSQWITSSDTEWTNPLPGFFLGFEMQETDFHAGLAFAGLATSTLDGQDGIFSFMLGLYGRVFNIGPTGQISLNVGIYGDPEFGFFGVTGGYFGDVARGFGTGWMVMEAGVDATFPLDFGTVAFSYGVVMPFDGDSEALGQQIAAQVTIPFGNGFSLIPGVIFRHHNDHLGNARNQTDLGVHMRFNF